MNLKKLCLSAILSLTLWGFPTLEATSTEFVRVTPELLEEYAEPVAIEAADVVLMDDDIGKLAVGMKIAKNTRKIVSQNIVFALGFKILVLILSIPGIATMWMAVFADVGVCVLAILNSMRKKD